MNKIQQKALEYSSRGYSVMPVKKDKKPILEKWKYLEDEKVSDEQIEKWFVKGENIGIITGKISGITVIDVDTYKGGDPAPFPETFTVRTGNGGLQLYYQYHPDFTISADSYPNMPGIDIRGDGGYVVAPPSITNYIDKGIRKGGEYSVTKNIPLAPFPAHLFPKTKPKRTLKETVGVKSGSRNDSIASVIGKLLLAHKEDVWYSEVLPAVEKINETYSPPLPLDELKTTFNSIVNIERNRKLALSDGVESDEEKEIRQAFAKNKIQGTYDLANYMVKKFDIITIGEHEREMFVYREGIYFKAENEIIYPEIQRILGHLVTKNAKTETYHKIADMTAHSRDIFTSADLKYIPLTNGVYDRISKQLLPHSPSYRFTYQLPVKYDASAICPKVSSFFAQVLDKEQIVTVEEWIGYYFLRSYMIKKAIIFVGAGDTGKTTLLQVINNLIGVKNIAGISLQKMASDKFAAAQMFEKHGNIVDELDPKDISGTGNFKIATGGGTISGEYKFGNQFVFNNFAKLTFACNKIPDVADFDDEAYFNRWLIIRLKGTIEKKILDFHKTLTTEEERSGLFNLAMVALDRLLEQGVFSHGKSAVETKLEMMRSGSSIAMFCAESITQENGAEISKEELYDIYVKFCNNRNLSVETIKMLGGKLQFYVQYVSEGLMNTIKNGEPERVKAWRNISVKKEEIITEEEEIQGWNN